MKDVMKIFSRKLQELRDDMGMNRKEFAQHIGMSPSTIGRYEKMEIQASLTAIKEIANKLNMNPGWFMGWTDNRYQDIAPPGKMIPVLGTIAAGKPITATEYVDGYECVTDMQNVDFCLRIKGDSMIGARIYNGDIVYIRKQESVENGEIAAVLIDGEDATLKRVYLMGGNVILRAENPNIPERVFTKEDQKEITILGKAVFLKGAVR